MKGEQDESKENGTTTPTILSGETTKALERLAAINARVKDFDPALKPQAVALLMEAEFGRTVRGPQPTVAGGREGSTVTVPNGAGNVHLEFSSLVEKWTPESNYEWALLAAYYVTKYGDGPDVTGQAMNSILKHHGKGIANITSAVDTLLAMDPALMLQTKKTGTSAQARKTYRVTTVGLKFVEDKLRTNGGAAHE
jgi:hypothetical protein